MAMGHWLQLALTDGVGPILVRRLVERAGSVAAACEADVALLQTVDGIGSHKARAIHQSLRRAAGEAEAEFERADRAGVRLICPDDPAYPVMLASIPDPPTVLWARGTLEPRDLHALAIVGSRKCSHYGREQAERFGALLAGAGFTILSGGARGVDGAAHRGALAHPHGRTLAVLGSGVDVPYPPEHAPLFEQIAGDGAGSPSRGAVLSEFPLGTPPLRDNFPRRNRIISGLSRGVLVVEADERSGALITARQACDDHGRPVFALPGRVDNPLSAGPHLLIRDGAVLVTKLEDIVEGLGPLPQAALESLPAATLFDGEDDAAGGGGAGAESREAATAPSVSEPPGLTDRQRLIVSHLGADPANVDSLVERSALPASVVLGELTFLSLKGIVKRLDGQTFVRKR